MSDGVCVIANGSDKAAINDLSDHELPWPAQRILLQKRTTESSLKNPCLTLLIEVVGNVAAGAPRTSLATSLRRSLDGHGKLDSFYKNRHS